MSVRKKIGILGGTFDPIHLAHLTLGESAYRQFGLDEVMFMPAKQPPHKTDKPVSPVKDRIAMVKRAIADRPYFTCSEFELGLPGKSYTAETLSALHQTHPNAQYYFILGGDSLSTLDEWYEPDVILNCAVLLAAVRENHDTADMRERIRYLTGRFGGTIHLLFTPLMEISSSDIRDRVEHGQDISELVPKTVEEYIAKKHLYSGTKDTNEANTKTEAKEAVKEEEQPTTGKAAKKKKEAKKDKSTEAEKEIKKEKSAEKERETKKDKSAEKEKETGKDKSAEKEKETGKDKPTEREKETGKDKPAEKEKKAGKDKPAEKERETKKDKPAEKEKKAGKDKPAEKEKEGKKAKKEAKAEKKAKKNMAVAEEQIHVSAEIEENETNKTAAPEMETELGNKPSPDQLRHRLSRLLKPHRYQHTLGVADMARHLAERFRIDGDKAYLAGLLHDCAKGYSDRELLKLCRKAEIPVSAAEKESPQLLHAKYGAWLAEHEYGVTDSEICSAIACHTTGKPGMTTLEKIIFVADYLEPGRNQAPHLGILRKLAETDLDLTVLCILQDTLEYLQHKGAAIDPMTRETYQWISESLSEKGEPFHE